MRKPATVLTIAGLLAVAGGHALRLWLEWPVTVAGRHVPDWLSGLAVLGCLGLAVGLTVETRPADPAIDARRDRERRPGRHDGPGRNGDHAPDREADGASAVATPPPAGLRRPADYFLFASEGVAPREIRAARAKYDRIMVGFDAGDIPAASLKAAKDAGAELEIYVEGPGGPTGGHWTPDERERIATAAASIGIDTSTRDWMRQWDRGGWKTYTLRQLEGFLRAGYAAAEIDNLDRVLGEPPQKTIAFYKEYAALYAEGRLPRLVTKNLSPEMLCRLVDAIETKELPRAMFAEFHISEKGSGNRGKQDALSSRIAIRTLASNDTHHYDASGEYGLHETFIALHQGDDSAVAEAPRTTKAV